MNGKKEMRRLYKYIKKKKQETYQLFCLTYFYYISPFVSRTVACICLNLKRCDIIQCMHDLIGCTGDDIDFLHNCSGNNIFDATL